MSDVNLITVPAQGIQDVTAVATAIAIIAAILWVWSKIAGRK